MSENSSNPPTPLHEFFTFQTKTNVLPERIPLSAFDPFSLPSRGGISPLSWLLFKSNQTRCNLPTLSISDHSSCYLQVAKQLASLDTRILMESHHSAHCLRVKTIPD
ncbi:unnamed protein product [Fraxinus pennsylvanica]|uniref:Uncharacterized protein n=1 Tax=Fraxinus pennsylvanica TaxID=56036 RepID=A0AAD1Z3C9_9LAMI|nr:unnamed protein product [Fraxinus pennsylvanica]